MKQRSARTKMLTGRMKHIGFNEKTALVYATLFDLGGTYPSRLASETGLNRSTVYKILLDLSVKGLVAEVDKKGKLFYLPENPTRLKRLTDMQVHLAEEHRDSAQRILPDLEELWSIHAGKPRVIYFEGAEEVRLMYEDHIAVEKPYEMLAIYNASEITNVLSPRWIQSVYMKRKAKLGITTRAVLPNTAEDRRFIPMAYRNMPRKFRPGIRYISGNIFPFESEITIYGKRRISIADLSKLHPIGVIIDDPTIFQTMKMLFELIWRSASPDRG